MTALKKLPGFQRAPAGLERTVLRHLPMIALAGTAMFTVALLCVIVMVAKGPAYVADAYPLIDSDRPAQ